MRKYFPAWPRCRSAVGEISIRRENFRLIWTKIFYWWKLPLWKDLVGIVSSPIRDNFSHMNSPWRLFILRKKLYLYWNADANANADADAEMPMPRFPNGPFSFWFMKVFHSVLINFFKLNQTRTSYVVLCAI